MSPAPSSDTEAFDPRGRAPARRRRRWLRRAILLGVLLVCTATATWHVLKPMPPGTNLASDWIDTPMAGVGLLTDTTVTDGHGRLIIRQHVFDEVLRIIGSAKEFVILDFYLFNDWPNVGDADSTAVHRKLSSEITAGLVARRRALPNLKVLFITDAINDVYGAHPSGELDELRAAGIDVVVTDLARLRDPNTAYSALWRLFVSWWTDAGVYPGSMPNPLEPGPRSVSFPTWLRLLNFKANHRKLIVADDGSGGLVGLITSANPQDASSGHSNIGLRFSGQVVQAMIASELDIARFSNWPGNWDPPQPAPASPDSATVRLRFLSEGAIGRELLGAIETAQAGESVSIAALYLTDRDVVRALLDAAKRDVRVRLILDPNKDAFGRLKDGVPNRSVAAELVRRGGGRIECRWYRTHGEQFHTKLVVVRRADVLWAMLGSADLTRRHLDNYDLNADIALEAGIATPLAQEFVNYFETLWQNDPAALLEYTTDFQTYEVQSFTRYWRYRLMEATGFSTF